MSWDDLSPPNGKAKTVERNTEMLKFCRLCYRVFELNTEGKEFLDLIKERFLMAPVCEPHKPAAYGYAREGENQLIRKIMKAIENHKEILNKGVNNE